VHRDDLAPASAWMLVESLAAARWNEAITALAERLPVENARHGAR
jgi:hypothetical protein